MANLQNFRNNQRPNWIEGLGQKAKQVAQFAGAVKGIYQVGQAAYAGIAAAAPYLEMAMLAGL
jgi:hypothetical protein